MIDILPLGDGSASNHQQEQSKRDGDGAEQPEQKRATSRAMQIEQFETSHIRQRTVGGSGNGEKRHRITFADYVSHCSER